MARVRFQIEVIPAPPGPDAEAARRRFWQTCWELAGEAATREDAGRQPPEPEQSAAK